MKAKLLILLIYFDLSIENDSASPAKLEVLTVDDCEDQKLSPPEGFACETEIAGKDSSRSFNAKVTLPFDVDKSVTYKATIKQEKDGKWVPLGFSLSGTVCDHVHQYIPGLWEKLSKAVNTPYDCPIKAGTFSVKGFTAEPSDVQFPLHIPGKFLLSILVLKNDTPVFCKQSELTITLP